MTQNNESSTLSRIEQLTEELAGVIKEKLVEFSTKVSEEFGKPHQAGILPYLRSMAGGSFRPDAKVVILEVNEESNDNKGTDSGTSGEGEKSAGSAKPAETPTVAG